MQKNPCFCTFRITAAAKTDKAHADSGQDAVKPVETASIPVKECAFWGSRNCSKNSFIVIDANKVKVTAILEQKIFFSHITVYLVKDNVISESG